MQTLTLAGTGEMEKDLALAALYERGTLGVTEHDLPGGAWQLEAFFDEPFDFGSGVWCAAPAPEIREAEPLAVGDRFYLVPAGRDEVTPEGRLRLTVHLRQASGSGYQPATQIALRALERHLWPGDRFLDMGAGSGILCEAARLLGSVARFGCDIDADALAQARENGTPAALFAGSVRSVRTASVNVVAANLNAQSLLVLRDDLMRVLAPGGRLIVSGFTELNRERLERAFGAPVLDRLNQEHWRGLVFQPA